MNKDTIVCFKGRVIRKTYDGGDYKVFAIDVDKDKYPNIKHTKYGNVTILGEINDLAASVEYEVRAVEELSKYGYGYRVVNIKREKPTSLSEMYIFLQEILTENQAKELYRVYPNIVDKVMNNDLDDIDLSQLKGIKEKTFNIIKQKIIENFCLAELVIEFQGLLSFSIINKLYNKYTSIDLLKEKLRDNPYKCLCGISGIGFKTADSILLTIEKESKNNVQNGKKPIIEFSEDLKTSKDRCLSCMIYLLEENENNGHTLMKIVDLRSQCMKLVPACCNYFVDCMKEDAIYYDKKLLTVSLKNTYDTEKYIAYKLIQGLLIGCKTQWNFDIEKYRNVNGCDLSNEQMKVPQNICKYAVSILNGSAGSGKSFSSQAAINMLEDHNKTYILFAPTGKAAKVIAEYTNRPASTIHRGLCYMPPNEWQINADHPLNCDVVIIDEFSMTDIFLFKHVLDAIDFHKTKLLIIGDSAQLPSVGCGNILHDLIESHLIPTVTLTKIFRYGEGGLMKVATDVRMCKPYLTSIEHTLTWFGDNKDYAFINVGDSLIIQNSVRLYQKLLTQGYQCEDIAFLTAYKKGEYGSIKINNALQKIANKNYDHNNFMIIGETKFFVNDLIMQTVNNYHAEIYYDDVYNDNEQIKETFIANGESGIIKEIHYGYAVIQFDDVIVKYYRHDMQTVSLGYAMTIHKSQGSSAKVVILITPKSHTFMLNSNLIYVGLTRMKEKCFHLGTRATVDIAVKKKANLIRHTNLQHILKETILTYKNNMEDKQANE